MRKILHFLFIIFIFCVISCKQEPAFEAEEITFEGKQFELVYFDDFDKADYSDNWRLMTYYSGQKGKYGDGSFITSKLGEVEEFNNVSIVDPEENVNAFTKDGVMHLVQTRVYDENTKDWALCLPALESKERFPVNSLYEMKYKMEVKGELSNYQIYLFTPDKFTTPNEKGYTFKQLFACELISGRKDEVFYTPNVWVGTKDIEYLIGIWERPTYDFSMPDSKFYDWHIVKILYTDSGFYVWHDNNQVYNYVWDEWKYGAPDCEAEIHIENNTCGDWKKDFFQDRLGKIDKSRKSVDFMFDYVKVYTLIK